MFSNIIYVTKANLPQLELMVQCQFEVWLDKLVIYMVVQSMPVAGLRGESHLVNKLCNLNTHNPLLISAINIGSADNRSTSSADPW